jgi:beta-aspartyl-peptidase (threonine type)
VLDQQTEAWNRGDLDGFMAHYWRSPDLTFSSGGQTQRGWQQTMDRYKLRYPTPERMGKVEFSKPEIRPLCKDAALVLGRWKLVRADPVGGNYSLVVQRIGGHWVITHDHTSTDAPP